MSDLLVPPCGYKGGKRRFAKAIAAEIRSHRPRTIYDVGAGSGAVSLALLAGGWEASRLTLVEAGPWGLFWAAAAAGTLDVSRIEALLRDEIPDDPRAVKAWVEDLAASGDRSPETFLVLQAAAFGSEAVWHDGTQWRRGSSQTVRRYSARGYWEPGPTSKESKPRGTIFTPNKIVERARQAAAAILGAHVLHCDVSSVTFGPGLVYVDPDYTGTSGYGWSMDVPSILERARGPVIVSEQEPRHHPDRVVALGNRKGGSLIGRGTARGRELLLTWNEVPHE
tara:strand:+ start:2732 stop:3574 length:843 start_codon:yes stop_codon:yes gene_type:complete